MIEAILEAAYHTMQKTGKEYSGQKKEKMQRSWVEETLVVFEEVRGSW